MRFGVIFAILMGLVAGCGRVGFSGHEDESVDTKKDTIPLLGKYDFVVEMGGGLPPGNCGVHEGSTFRAHYDAGVSPTLYITEDRKFSCDTTYSTFCTGSIFVAPEEMDHLVRIISVGKKSPTMFPADAATTFLTIDAPNYHIRHPLEGTTYMATEVFLGAEPLVQLIMNGANTTCGSH